ncbi:MAG: hypothetical protein HF981_09220 [Desulfobacteraceae bacterium]|nr:hypothetical protein [Desulfobacteraceae bacterium]MBC2750551.1 hypothetical protein [Desulfobacteraceae bacterium]
MHHRKQTKVLFALVFFTVALLSFSPLWAQSATPNFTETIIDGNTKVVSNSDGTVTVFFLDEDCTSPATDDCWVKADPQQGEICICTDGSADCDIFDSTVNVECYPIKQAGAGTTGCLVSRNPRTYLIGGDAYTRP